MHNKIVMLFFFSLAITCVYPIEEIDFDNKLELKCEELLILQEVLNGDNHSAAANQLLQNEILKFSNNLYSNYTFNKGFYEVICDKKTIHHITSEVIRDIDTFWDQRAFLIPRAPTVIGKIADKNAFSKVGVPRCMHLPIKFPNSEIRVPNEYLCFYEAIKKILDFEGSVNKNLHEYYAYLTVDQRFVPKNKTPRIEGAHVDGIPRDRKKPHLQKIDHCYLITDSIPTKFFVHPFDLTKYDLDKHHFFEIMDLLADETQSILSIAYDINLMNAYTVHTSFPAASDCIRTLLRIEFSILEFNRKGNSINPYFDYKWEPKDCRIPIHLEIPRDLQVLQ